MVLDPLTALSVAGTIVQFVDFGTKILSRSRQLYHSTKGALALDEELDLIITHLTKLTAKLIRPLSTPSTENEASEEEQALRELCDACNTVAQEMVERLEGFKVDGKHRIFKSVWQALKSIWSEKEANDLVRRLSMFRESLELHILVELRGKIDLLSLQHSERYATLDEGTKRILNALLDNETVISTQIREQTMAVTQLLNQTEVVLIDQNNKTCMMIIDAIKEGFNQTRTPEGMKEVTAGDVEILSTKARTNASAAESSFTRGQNFTDVEIPKLANAEAPREKPLLETSDAKKAIAKVWSEEERIRKTVEKALLKSFDFPTMMVRQEEIAQAHKKTFAWIFQDEHSGVVKWTNFVQWLQSGSGVYWINGKAGSGKSTLMRYLIEHHQTRALLDQWAGSTPLSIASFFFWNSGTNEQRSQIGLLRALLFQILSQYPQLIPIVIPWQWSRKYSQLVSGSVENEPDIWTISKLKQALRLLVEQTAIPLKLCLFVDGLDEYDDNEEDTDSCHQEIAELFKNATSNVNIKICLSSRPLLVFKDAFGALSGLRLQDLSFDDIKQYVGDRLGNNPRYRQLTLEEPEQAPGLVDEIVNKADGVFIWVTLVVKSLLSGLGKRDGIADLQRRLRLLPSDLEDLYHHMLTRIEPFYQHKASQIFQIFQTHWKIMNGIDQVEGGPGFNFLIDEPLTVMALSFAVDDDPHLPIRCEIEPLSFQAILSRCNIMSDRLKVRCAGLLEVQGPESGQIDISGVIGFGHSPKVQYLHRTVRDYLEKPEVWNKMVAHTSRTDFDPYTALLGSYIVQLKLQGASDSRSVVHLRHKASIILEHAAHTDLVTGRPNAALLDEFDRTMAWHLEEWSKENKLHWADHGALGFGSRSSTRIHDSFLPLAVRYNLCAYVEQKLLQKHHQMQRSTAQSLLDFSVNPVFQSTDRCYSNSPKVVALLLKYGAEPNKNSNGRSPWENALLGDLELHEEKEIGEMFNEDSRRIRAGVLRTLIQHGANPGVRVRWKDGVIFSPSEVIKICFQDTMPDEESAIQDLLRSKGAEVAAGNGRSLAAIFADWKLPWGNISGLK
ncbi:hypothetical protein N431DRAFT_481115 [Stipitochalara longipes BDJ]|nr:hypothetical protein N431DRAFT_481115 [Stipitochalara longipes BDJ]